MNIITLAFDMAKAVESFVEKAKRFFYSVMLLGHHCPKCNGSLTIVPEGKSKCVSCGNEFDPTVTFQRCSLCGGTPVLRVSRYQCSKCHSDIQSRFVFDGVVFDSEYFRQKAAESRQRKKDERERVRKMLAESRSGGLPLGPISLAEMPGLVDALNSLTAGLNTAIVAESRDEFDLKRYEKHIQAHIRDLPLSLDEIPPLSKESAKKDLIWRFIAVVFLAHAAVVDIWQEGQDIMVIKHEVNRKRCDVLGELEDTDGIERPMGGIEA